MESAIGQAEQVGLRVDPAIMAVGEGDVQAVTEVGHFDDGEAGESRGKPLVDSCAKAMGAFAGDAELLGGEGDAIALRRRHRKRRQIGAHIVRRHGWRNCRRQRHGHSPRTHTTETPDAR